MAALTSSAVRLEVEEGTSFALSGSRRSRGSTLIHDLSVPLNIHEPVQDAKDNARVGVFGATLNLVNVIIGSGIVGLSVVGKAAGVVPFTVFICLSAFLAYFTLTMLVEAAEYTHRKSYEAIGAKALGSYGAVLTPVVIILQNLGGMTSRLMLMNESAPPVLKLIGLSHVSVQTVQFLLTGFIIFPLCLLRDLSMLSYTSFFALCTFILIALTSVWILVAGDTWYELKAAPNTEEGVNWSSFNFSAFQELPTVVFAFVCHTACLPIYSQLSAPSKERMAKVAGNSIATASILYSVTGLAGYITYKAYTMGVLFNNWRHCSGDKMVCEDDSVYIGVLNGLFLIGVVLGYPSVHFPTRRAVIALTVGVDAKFSMVLHCAVATGLVGTTLVIATALPDVSTAFSWTGVIASPLLVFVLPAFYHQEILRQEECLAASHPRRLKGICIAVFGLVFMAIGICVKVASLF